MDFLNHSMITNGTTQMSKMAIFLFIIAGNYVGDIYSCELRHFFNDSMIFKHIIGIFIMLFFVGISDNDASMQMKLLNSVLLYIWFLFVMRAPKNYTLVIILIISILYLLNMYITDLKKNKNSDEKYIEQVRKITNSLFLLAIVISIVGFLKFYLFALNNIDNFNHYQFLLGTRDQECFSKIFADKFNKSGSGIIPFKLRKRMGKK